MTDFAPSPPEKEQIALLLPDADLTITQFTEYSFESNFLEPADRWTFTVAGETLSPELREALVPGVAVKLSLNGSIQSAGFVDSIQKTASRGSGVEWRVEGRDRLGQAVDACANPTQELKESMSILEAMKTLFAPFGWSNDEHFIESNEANRQLKAGGVRRGKRQTSDAKGFGRRAIRAAKIHQYRPYAREGVYEFATRISQRFGLWIWSTANGEQLVVSEPDFDIDPYYKLTRNASGDTNVLEGSVKFDLTHQPTYIVADTRTQAGEFGAGAGKAIYANVAVTVRDSEQVPSEIQKYIDAGARVLGGPTLHASSTMIVPRHKILYLNDPESQTLEQLESFIRREMALLQRKSLTTHYTVEGHGQVTDEGFIPWVIDSTVEVEDEVAGLSERLYVLGRTFNKSRSGGTTTQLELIRRNTLVFSSTGK